MNIFLLPRKRLIRYSIMIAAITTTIATLAAIICHFQKNNTQSQNIALAPSLPPLQNSSKSTNKSTQNNTKTITYTVPHNGSLSHLFQIAGLSQKTLITLLKNKTVKEHLANLLPGQTLTLTKKNNHFSSLTYPFSPQATLLVTLKNGSTYTRIKKIPYTKTLGYQSGTITHSLNDAAKKAGLNTRMRAELTQMLKGRVNLSRDIHKGDQFFVLYNEFYLHGKKNHPGHILAAELIDHHKRYQVIRYQLPHQNSGYYTPYGHAVSPLFLKFPCHFKRISSRFNRHRLDPILHRIHPHLGIDLATPIGTPVRAIGNGYVLFHGWDHGYGNAIIIRYNHTYKTLYGHLNKFAKNIKNHHYVKRGQIVAYSGSTGWSTGPHVHFEIYKDKKPINPLKMKTPHNPAIPNRLHQQYLAYANHLLTELHLFQQTQRHV